MQRCVFVVASLLCVACGGDGSGGSSTTTSPTSNTNQSASSTPNSSQQFRGITAYVVPTVGAANAIGTLTFQDQSTLSLEGQRDATGTVQSVTSMDYRLVGRQPAHSLKRAPFS